MHFSPEVSLGAIVEIIIMLIMVAGAFIKIGRLETKLNIMFDWFQRTIIGGSKSHPNPPSDEEIRRFHGKG